MTESPPSGSGRRAIILTLSTSVLIPIAGVLTAPILARALNANGRGELAAALAPSALAVAVATFGLPDALAYLLAKHPEWRSAALIWASAVTALLGAICLLLVFLARVPLSGGNQDIADYAIIATALAIPALVLGAFRGAALGMQLWALQATERVLGTILRVILLLVLWLSGHLTVLTAVLVTTAVPVLSGLVYARLLGSRRHQTAADPPPLFTPLRPLVQFGSRVWLGSVASMTLNRMTPLIMVPLSGAVELGYYSVAATIADVPLVVALAIQGALFGLHSREPQIDKLTNISRATVLATFAGCAVIGATLPLWISAVFGRDFADATLPTELLLVSSVICVPGLMASSVLSAWGRPGLRSLTITITLAVNVAALFVLVPVLGAVGAAVAGIVSNLVFSVVLMVMAARLTHISVLQFLPVRRSDYIAISSDFVALLANLLERLQAVSARRKVQS